MRAGAGSRMPFTPAHAAAAVPLQVGLIGGVQGRSVALIGLGLPWRLGGARAALGERPT